MRPQKILIAHYSRSGHTAKLAAALARELEHRGCEVTREEIRGVREWNKWLLPLPLLPLLPFLPLYLLSAAFRRLWHRRLLFQPGQAIRPLVHPDVAAFDQVLIGTPKWLYLAFPVARWLREVRGLEGRRVSAFATFCGPPLAVFELEMLFAPLDARLEAKGAVVGEHLAISSAYHPYFFCGEMEMLFRWLSKKVFGRPLLDFTLEGEVGRAALTAFCERVVVKPMRSPSAGLP